MCNWSSFSWVSPFRNRRIKGYLLLPGAYRSLSRLSSALSAKASTICSFMLDQIDLCRFITQMLAPSVALIWFRFYNSFHRWNMVYRNHLVLILGHRLFSEVIQYFRCTLGCLVISFCKLDIIDFNFNIRFSRNKLGRSVSIYRLGLSGHYLFYLKGCKVTHLTGLKWTRTTDLTLIRRAL